MVRGVVVSFAMNLMAGLMGLAALFVMARELPAESIGMVGFALGVVGSFSWMGSMGLHQAHVRELAGGTNPRYAWGTYRDSRRPILLAFATVTSLVIWIWHDQIGFVDATLGVLVLILAMATAQQARHYYHTVFEVRQDALRMQSLNVVETMVRSAILIAISLSMQGGDIGRIAEWLAGGYALAAFVSLGFGWWLARHRIPKNLERDSGLRQRYWAFALPISFAIIVSTLNSNLDRVFIGFFWDAREVAMYFASQRLVSIFLAIPAAFVTLLFPVMARMNREGANASVTIRSVQRAMVLTLAPVAAMLAAFSPSIIHILLSDEFREARWMLVGLAVYLFIVGLQSVWIPLVKGAGMTRWFAASALLGAVVNVALNLFLVPDSILGVPTLGWRGEGAVIATSAAAATNLAMLAWRGRRIVRVPYRWADLPPVLTAAGLGWLASLDPVLNLLGGVDRFYELLAAGAVFAGLYLLAMTVLGLLNRDDALVIRNSLRPRI